MCIEDLLAEQRNLMVGWREIFDNKGPVPSELDYTYYENEMIRINDELYRHLRERKLDIEEKLRLTEYMFITVNPMEDISLNTLINSINKYLSKITILEYIYVIEQRGTTDAELGKGIHAHMLVRHTSRKASDFKREAISTFKNVCDCQPKGNPTWFRKLNILPCDTSEDVERRREYMLGVKQDELKQTKQLLDKKFREKFKLKPFYAS